MTYGVLRAFATMSHSPGCESPLCFWKEVVYYVHVRPCLRNAVAVALSLAAYHTVHDLGPTLGVAEPSVVGKMNYLEPFQLGVGDARADQPDLAVVLEVLKAWIRPIAVAM